MGPGHKGAAGDEGGIGGPAAQFVGFSYRHRGGDEGDLEAILQSEAELKATDKAPNMSTFLFYF